MTIIKTKLAKTFLSALLISGSFIVPAAAADMQYLPDIAASQIAGDSVRSYDSRTGVSIVTAPTFDPFEQDQTLAGTAALRTGPSETTIDGQRVVGGAYLDLKMIYTSASDDPYDIRGYEQAYYVSGEDISRIRQNVQTLDCASNTTEVVYQDDYYNRYDSYGYLAGLYLLLPRYRGHRGYWSGGSRHRPSAGWSDWRRRGGYGGYAGGRGYGYGGHGIGSRGHSTRSDRRRSGNGTRGDRTRGTGAGRDGSTVSTGGTVTTPRTRRHNARTSVVGGSAENRRYQRQRGVVAGGPLEPAAGNTRQTERQNTRNRDRSTARTNRADRARNIRQGRSGSTARQRNINPTADTTQQPVSRNGRPEIDRTVTSRGVNPAGRSPRAISAPTVRQAAPPRVTRAAPVQRSQPKPRSQPKTRSESKTRSQPKPRSSRRLNREVDRSFRNNKTGTRNKRQLNFFPMLGGYNRAASSVVTHYRCVREETVTLHISQERLEAARFDGMTLIVVDNADRDVPVYLPPNYIEGFRQAAGQSTAPSQSYNSGYGSTQPYSAPQPETVTEPAVQGRYPLN